MLWALVGLGGLAAAVAGLLVHLLWRIMDLPDAPPPGFMAYIAKPFGLGRFMFLVFPLAVWLPTAVLALSLWLAPNPPEELDQRRMLLLDAVSYLCLPVVAVMALIWDLLGNVWLAVGLVFMGLITYKAWLLSSVVWRWHLSPRVRPEGRLGWPSRAVVFMAALIVLVMLSSWVEQATSSTHDDVGMLLAAQYIAHDSPRADKAAEVIPWSEYRRFYWLSERPTPSLEAIGREAPLFPMLMAPGFLLGNRSGVLIVMALLAAFLALQMLLWLEECGVRPAPAASATALVMFSAPLLFVTQQVVPETLGALGLVLGLRLVAHLPRRPFWSLLGVVFIAGLLPFIHVRMAPLGAGLVLAALYSLTRQRWGVGRAAALGLGFMAALAGGMALLARLDLWPQWLGAVFPLDCLESELTLPWWDTLGRSLAGRFLDQATGLLPAAPLLVLALGGLPAALRRFPAPAVAALFPCLLMILLVGLMSGCSSASALESPGRWLGAMLPAAALFMTPCLAALSGPWRRMAVVLPAGLGLAYTWALTLMPPLRMVEGSGVNRLVETFEGLLNLSLYHLLPSTHLYSPGLWIWAGAALAAAAVLAVMTWPRDPAAIVPSPPGFSANEIAATALAIFVLAGGLAVAARLNPPSVLDAELMASRRAPIWILPAARGGSRGRAMVDNGYLIGRMSFAGGEARLSIEATSDRPGVVRVILGNEDKGGVLYRGDKGLDIELGRVPAGEHTVALRWLSCDQPDCTLRVDRVVLKPGSGPPIRQGPK